MARSLKLECFGSLDALPVDCASLFPADDFFSSEIWYRTTIEAALPDDASACFVACTIDGQTAAVFPMQIRQAGAVLESLTSCYSCLYHPLLCIGIDAASLRRIGKAFGRFCRRWPAVRMDALPADWPALAPLLAGFREAGLMALRFDHFRNCYEPVENLSWGTYFASRPTLLQELVRRRTRRMCREGGTFTLVTGGDALDTGIAAYQHIYARSWKAPEPFPAFNLALMRRAASRGLLRLGLLCRQGNPIAAQFWLLADAHGVLFKLAHDEAYRSLSPGTVLTAWMIRGLLEQDHVTMLDFGRGDDSYKGLWAGQRCQRIGLVLANPLHWQGAATIGGHLVGRARKRLRDFRTRQIHQQSVPAMPRFR